MNTNIINRETLNGIKWSLVIDKYGVSLYRGDQFSGYWFRTIEEAQAHLDAVDERVRAPRVVSTPLDCSAFYGRGSNVYYGD